MRKLTSRNVIWEDWEDGTKPFDMMRCGWCLTMHTRPCDDPEHKVLSDTLKKGYGFRKVKGKTGADYPVNRDRWVKKYFSKFAALRLKYARFYE